MSLFNLPNLTLSQLKCIEPIEFESYQALLNEYRLNPTNENEKLWDYFENRYMSILEKINEIEEFNDLQ